MKITREQLADLITTEVRRRLRELVEADDGSTDDGEPKKKKGKGKPESPETADASSNPTKKGKPPAGAGPQADVGSPDVSTPEVDQDSDTDGPAVDGDEPDPEAIDADGENGEEPSGAVNDEVSGKTVQAVTIEPKSKVLPGAKEIVIAFNESTDALRILVTPTGSVKFFWRGQLHDLP